MLRKYTTVEITGSQKCSKCGKPVKVGFVTIDENTIICKDCNENKQEPNNE